eukprot:SAG31_NODE_2062_length_6536_cov_8.777691_2_plen_216_part_00
MTHLFVCFGQDPSTWKATNGPITYDHLWHGEIYDATREVSDWSAAPLDRLLNDNVQSGLTTATGVPPAGWTPAVAMSPIVGTLSPQLQPPIRVVQSFKPVNVTTQVQHVREAGCADGSARGRFIRCPNCTGSSPKFGSLLDAVFYQTCSDKLFHLQAGFAGSCSVTPPILVQPAVLIGWQSRYEGAFTCDSFPVNRTDSLTVVDFGQVCYPVSHD